MSEQEAPWREWLYLGPADQQYRFVLPIPTAPGVPARCVCHDFDWDHPASQYWVIRNRWNGLGPDDFQAFYDKWAPRRDKALDPDESYLGKSYPEWQMFYTALADERQYRQHMYAKLDGLHGREILSIWYDKPKEGPMDEARAQQATLGGRAG